MTAQAIGAPPADASLDDEDAFYDSKLTAVPAQTASSSNYQEDLHRRADCLLVEADTIARLAKMSAIDYDKCRETEAKSLGVRTSTLDAEVKKARAHPAMTTLKVKLLILSILNRGRIRWTAWNCWTK